MIQSEGPMFGVPLNELFKRNSTYNDVPCLVNHVTANIRANGGLALEGIFRVPGSNPDIIQLKKMYNEGKITSRNELSDLFSDLHTQASLLKLFIRELPDSLLTFSLYESFVQSHKSKDRLGRVSSIRVLLNQLPLAHYSLLKHLTCLLRDIANQSMINKMTASNLAIVFGPTVMRPQHEDTVKMIEDAKHVNGVFFLILEEFDYLFHNAEFPSFIMSATLNTQISPSLVAKLAGKESSPHSKRNAMKFTSGSAPFSLETESNQMVTNGGQHQHQHVLSPPTATGGAPYDDFLSAMALRSPPTLPSHSSQPGVVGGQDTLSSPPLMPTLLPTTPTQTTHSASISPPRSPRYTRFRQQLGINNIGVNGGNNNGNGGGDNSSHSSHSSHSHSSGGGGSGSRFSILVPQLNNNMASSPRSSSYISPSLLPLPPSSPRNSISLDDNAELMRLLINKTCSVLFDREMPITDSFEIARGEEFFLATPQGSSSSSNPPASPRNTAPSSPRYHARGGGNDSSSSSPQLRSLLKSQLLNNLTTTFILQQDSPLGGGDQQQQQHLLPTPIMKQPQQQQQPTSPSAKTTTTSTSQSMLSPRSGSSSGNTSPMSSSKKVVLMNQIEQGPLELAWSHLLQIRRDAGRPSDLQLMSALELCDEKSSIKKELREFDLGFKRQNGHLPKKNDKEIMRPLYQRYREVKAMIDQLPTSPKSAHHHLSKSTSNNDPNNSTSPSPSPTTTTTTNNNSNNNKIDQSSPMSLSTSGNNSAAAAAAAAANEREIEESLRQLSPNVLQERQSRLKHEKRTLQMDLHRYQTDFTKKHGRRVQFLDDRLPVQKEYERYKHLKIELTIIDKLLLTNNIMSE
ncbi:hypothetical protein SAMD00019534_018550 [Acytostelium subglobosum LB1]|uniref:hypothetical protein n=1 Tax=Acytostelium subglobosum LB1 TaxID=1410327 RepID=UPI000644B1BA|nr:hypothetical protein SAMD00019534_018550 [Acytostelium subglobosum LB1]GAM18680.1 hypothetical protein SAMD00019534_018550 [Acytostelium subglobosum LB1]|eukprot:XP_012757900.1 hypothetical protein SAMD00019534_018550 [Acytostelium subglobosum LB1]